MLKYVGHILHVNGIIWGNGANIFNWILHASLKSIKSWQFECIEDIVYQGYCLPLIVWSIGPWVSWLDTVKTLPGCKVSPLVRSIFFGQNVDLTSGLHCINKHFSCPGPLFYTCAARTLGRLRRVSVLPPLRTPQNSTAQCSCAASGVSRVSLSQWLNERLRDRQVTVSVGR